MSNSTGTLQNDFFSSLVSDIKTYKGKDPLLPWLRGMRKMKESLPPQLLEEKLPRFLQKCTETFEYDRRYCNDLRYLRVWLQLMDFVDDPKALLRTMEENHIGMKKTLFYQAYALYYEKIKKFDKAEKMYFLAVQNLAEPIDELQKSYEQFLQRMQQNKEKKIQRQQRMTGKGLLHVENLPTKCGDTKRNTDNICEIQPSCTSTKNDALEERVQNKIPKRETNPTRVAKNLCNVVVSSNSFMKKVVKGDTERGKYLNQLNNVEAESDECNKFCSEETVVGQFVDIAIVGKSEAENARHHGLVEPTINTKEALNTINSMFRQPLDPSVNKRSNRMRPKATDQRVDKGFEVFIDDNVDKVGLSNQNEGKSFELMKHNRSITDETFQGPLQIYVDEESYGAEERDNEDDLGRSNAFVFTSAKDLPSECSIDLDAERLPRARLREDTVVCKFVGATISDEPQVENVCHHGLVEPTINLKEAMDDINNMFGKPIDFVRTTRQKKQEKTLSRNNQCNGFVILPDDVLDQQREHSSSDAIAKNKTDLFEQTVYTKEALDEINKMFAMPLDF